MSDRMPTKAQARALKELSSGCTLHWMSGLDSYWFLSGSHRSCTRTAEVLIARGWVETNAVSDSSLARRWAVINDAGREAIARYEAKHGKVNP